MKRVLILVAVLGIALAPVSNVLAEGYDPNQIYYEYNNNIIFRQNGNEENAACGATALPPTNTKLDAATLGRINNLKSTYLTGAEQTGVRWEVIAALDYREDNNNPNSSILGGEPLGQKATDSGYAPATKLESIIDGMIILKAKKPIYGVDPTKPMTFLQLQQAFITYNRGNSYAVAGVSPDKSPYVMNQYDDAHKNMTFPSLPGETLAGRTETRYGAMTVLANLVAEGDNSTECVGGGVGAKVDYTGLYPNLPAGTLKDSQLCSPRPDIPSFKLLAGPACESFKALDLQYKRVFGKLMPLSGGYRTAQQQIDCGGTRSNPGGYNPNCIYYDPNTPPPEHLWGTAIDFSGPLSNSGTQEHNWLVKNGPLYGWFWPNWAKDGFGGNAGSVEPWHFAYYFVGHNPNSDKLESYK